jgi:hypothetical protein
VWCYKGFRHTGKVAIERENLLSDQAARSLNDTTDLLVEVGSCLPSTSLAFAKVRGGIEERGSKALDSSSWNLASKTLVMGLLLHTFEAIAKGEIAAEDLATLANTTHDEFFSRLSMMVRLPKTIEELAYLMVLAQHEDNVQHDSSKGGWLAYCARVSLYAQTEAGRILLEFEARGASLVVVGAGVRYLWDKSNAGIPLELDEILSTLSGTTARLEGNRAS